ncbi:hypothetical protein BS17DRAFT_134660 [Gyrodon lividus]|nr:hypothetical protein BS17DRAFT_134660 [Gyrodon lividus]
MQGLDVVRFLLTPGLLYHICTLQFKLIEGTVPPSTPLDAKELPSQDNRLKIAHQGLSCVNILVLTKRYKRVTSWPSRMVIPVVRVTYFGESAFTGRPVRRTVGLFKASCTCCPLVLRILQMRDQIKKARAMIDDQSSQGCFPRKCKKRRCEMDSMLSTRYRS